jgi:hypothetical protein
LNQVSLSWLPTVVNGDAVTFCLDEDARCEFSAIGKVVINERDQ